MLYSLPKIMLECLLLTIVFECLLGFILGVRDKKDLLNIALVNALTNPLVVSISVIINSRYGLQTRHVSMVFLELFALLVEALIYKKVLKFKKINPFILSLLLNACSFIAGLLINI